MLPRQSAAVVIQSHWRPGDVKVYKPCTIDLLSIITSCSRFRALALVVELVIDTRNSFGTGTKSEGLSRLPVTTEMLERGLILLQP